MIRPLRRLFLFGAFTLILIPPAIRIPLGFLPGEGSPIIAVTVELKGSFAETVESTITIPLEDELYELPGLETISSVSQGEESRVLLFFDEETQPDAAYLSVREAVDRASARFPDNAQRPRIGQSDPSARPVFVVALPDSDEADLRRLFEQIEGLGGVSVGGGIRRELLIRPKGERLAATGSSLPELFGSIGAIGVVGSFHRRNESPLLLDSRPRSADEFGAALLAPGVPLSSLAEVAVSSAERRSVSRINGQAATVVTASAAGGANEVLLCRDLRRLSKSMPGAEILYDYGRSVEEAVSEAAVALGIGAAAVALVAFLFLGRPRSAVAVAGSIPFCALSSVAALAVLGMQLDVMSLAGIAVGVGIVVDSGIIYAEFSRRRAGDQLRVIREARGPILQGSVTTVVVFLPLIFASPSVYLRFAGLAVAICASVAASVVYVFGLLPALLSLRFRGGLRPAEPRQYWENRPPPPWFSMAFQRVESARRWDLIPIWGAALIAPFLLVALPRDAGATLDDGLLRVRLEYPAATTARAVEAAAGPLEERLLRNQAVRRATATFEQERVRFEIDCSDCGQVRDFLDEEARKGSLGGLLFYPDDIPDEVRIPVVITGESPGDARSAARVVAKAADSLVTVDGVIFHFKESPDATVVHVDIASMRRRGVSPRLPATVLYWAMAGPVAAKWQPPGEELDIRVAELEVAGGELLENVLIAGETAIPLSAVASVSREPGIGRFHRHNRRPSSRLSVVTSRNEAQDTAAALRAAVPSLTLPRGTTVVVDPDAGDRESQRRRLLLMATLSLFLVLAVIMAAFESLPALCFCLLQLPLSWLPPAAYLTVTGTPLSPAVALGLVVTAGVAVNNTILLYQEALSAEPQVALWRSLGPMAIASTTTIIGVFPLLFVGSASVLGRIALVLSAGSVGSLGSLLLTFPGARRLTDREAPSKSV